MENKTLDLTLTRFAARESWASVERPEIRMALALSRAGQGRSAFSFGVLVSDDRETCAILFSYFRHSFLGGFQFLSRS